MSDRMKEIAQSVASDARDTSAYPEFSGLAALRGDFAALQRELVQEAAHSMGSSTRRLEASFATLQRLDEALDRLDSQQLEQRRELVQRFNAARDEVLLRLHYIEIQREALGFTRHGELHEHYPVPPRKHR
ncbi:MAG TPA: hypothetical protein VFK05_34865 [Polyangiaceae bacterium]|nr:hypothetical protein [Polyangiaceae bacterium]